MNVAIVVPVLNASAEWSSFAPALLKNAEFLGLDRQQVLVIDSSSTDNTADLVKNSGFRLHQIPRSAFNHGRTRQLALELMATVEIFVYLTQDAVLATPDAVARLVSGLDDEKIGAVYGRQVPRAGSTAIEAHARLFNYPGQSMVRGLESRQQLGLKSVFCSNSFAAYRRAAMNSVGGFDPNVVFGEDTILVARLHLSGWKTAYVADAKVYHSHSYSIMQEFSRYFDVGVLHSRERWLIDEFGGAGGEGGRFVRSEVEYLAQRDPFQIPAAIFRTAVKYTGYRLGLLERWLPLFAKRRLAMNKVFWATDPSGTLRS